MLLVRGSLGLGLELQCWLRDEGARDFPIGLPRQRIRQHALREVQGRRALRLHLIYMRLL